MTYQLPDKFRDLRKFAPSSHNGYPDHPHARTEDHILGICLHQSAMDRGEDAVGYYGMGAHYSVTRGGFVNQHVDDTTIGAFANDWNTGCISIEFVGLYAGIIGDHTTLWDNPATPKHEIEQLLTPAATVAGLQLIDYLVARYPSIRKLVAHRQVAASRISDPGQAIWWGIALPSSKKHTLDYGGDGFKMADGKPIPTDWDPSSTFPYR